MLDQIKEKLEETFSLPVYYGSSLEASGKKVYDYIVFWRDETTLSPGPRGDRSVRYIVSMVRKDYIPEDDEVKMVLALDKIKGLKHTGNITYDFMEAPGTALGLEVAQCTFAHAVREC